MSTPFSPVAHLNPLPVPMAGLSSYLERVVYKYIPDLTVLYIQFKTGDIDVIGLQYITPDNYNEAKGLPGRIVELFPSASIECFALNTERPQFKDPAVRQALYYAFDKDTIIKELNYGLPSATESYMPQRSFYYNPNLPKHEYAPAKGRAILNNAGWCPEATGSARKMGSGFPLQTPRRSATTSANRHSSSCSRHSGMSASR